jgi:hypothetical protein
MDSSIVGMGEEGASWLVEWCKLPDSEHGGMVRCVGRSVTSAGLFVGLYGRYGCGGHHVR